MHKLWNYILAILVGTILVTLLGVSVASPASAENPHDIIAELEARIDSLLTGKCPSKVLPFKYMSVQEARARAMQIAATQCPRRSVRKPTCTPEQFEEYFNAAFHQIYWGDRLVKPLPITR